MRRLGWIALAALLLALSVAMVAWPELRQLYRDRVRHVVHSDHPQAAIGGVDVAIESARFLIAPSLPDRAAIYLRIELHAEGNALAEWPRCDLYLTDRAGRRWLPLYDAAGDTIVQTLAMTDGSAVNCDQSLFATRENGGPAVSAQAFLVPSDVLDELRVTISSTATHPDVLSLPLRMTQVPFPE